MTWLDFRLPIFDWEKLMNEKAWIRVLCSYSDNLKSKIQKVENGRGLSFWLLSLTVAGAVAQAQQPNKISRIGYLIAVSPSASANRVKAFQQGLRELGYAERNNIVIEYRYAEGKLDRLPALATELVRLKVDIIVTAGGQATRAAKEATSTIPIVMTNDRRSRCLRVRRQSCAAGKKRYWLVHACPGVKRKTAGAS